MRVEPDVPRVPGRQANKFYLVNQIQLRANVLAHGACEHATFCVSTQNNWGINFRCSCTLRIHARWGRAITEGMGRDVVLARVKAAVGQAGF